jgi:hypothetical protein
MVAHTDNSKPTPVVPHVVSMYKTVLEKTQIQRCNSSGMFKETSQVYNKFWNTPTVFVREEFNPL